MSWEPFSTPGAMGHINKDAAAVSPSCATWKESDWTWNTCKVVTQARVITRSTDVQRSTFNHHTFNMPPHRDYSSSVVPPTLSPTHSCSSSQMSSQLEDTPCPLPQPVASDQFVDDLSDIDDSDPDDDLSPVFEAMIVSCITVLSCILDIVYFNAFPFLTRLSRFPKTIWRPKFSACKLKQNASLRYRSASLPMQTFERQC